YYSSSYHPDLHSFPTRRSYDLPNHEVETNAMDILELSSLCKIFSKKPLIFKGTLNHAPVKILIDNKAMDNFMSKQAADHFSFSLDRKSTRLNSSHSQISYAVFC